MEDSKFLPGSIKKVVVKNFMTYTCAEMRPGPGLNLVIGPNGSGKSTMVCAIALGLGGSPKDLGRSNDIGAFIKTGETQASIEIQLHPDTSVQRIINQTINDKDKISNISLWKHNGSNISQKELIQILKDLHIDTSSLIQVMPQERVGDFARFTPPELLNATITSIVSSDYVEIMENIYSGRSKQDDLSTQLNSALAQEKLLTAKKARLDAEIEQLDVRKKIEEKIAVLENLRPWLELKKLDKNISTMEIQVNERKDEIDVGKESIELFKLMASDYSVDYDELQIQPAYSVAGLSEALSKQNSVLKRLDQSIQSKAKYADKKEKLASDIEAIKTSLVEFDIDKINEDMKVASKKINAVSVSLAECRRRKQQHESENKSVLRSLSTLRRTYAQISEAGNAGCNFLRETAHEQWKLAETYENVKRLKFTESVIGPLCLCIKFKGMEVAKILEKWLPMDFLATFIVFNAQDRKTLMSQQKNANVTSFENLRTSEINTLASLEEKCQTKLSRYGLKGFGIEFVDLKNGVAQDAEHKKTILAGLSSMNSTLGHCLIADTKFETLEQHHGEIFSKIQEAGLTSFSVFTPRRAYRVNKSRYSGGSSTSISEWDIRYYGKGRNNKSMVFSSDLDSSADLEMAKQELEVKRQEWRELETKGKTINAELTSLMSKQADLRSQVAALEKQTYVHNRLELDLSSSTEKLKKMDEESEEALGQEIEDLHKSFISSNEKFHDDLAEAMELEQSIFDDCISQLESDTSVLSAMKPRAYKELHLITHQKNKESMKIMKRKLKNAEQDLESLRRQFQKKQDSLQNVAPLSEFQKTFEELRITNLNALESELEVCYETIKNTVSNPAKYQEFEQTKESLAKLNKLLKKLKAEVESGSAKYEKDKILFEKTVKHMISSINTRFAALFKKINDAGFHVEGKVELVTPDDDIAEENKAKQKLYGIGIYVRFRENQKLEILSTTVQSGGERSLSTFLFLLALQDGKSPFRVVDEINQGMDAQKERLAFARLRELCEEGVGCQYFLVTPKLLTGLEYGENVSVHVIMNGVNSFNLTDEMN